MDIDSYKEIIRKFAIYPEANSCSLNERMYLALGLGGETGEVLEKVKKAYRDNKPIDKEEIIKELGDVAWYWARLCDAFMVDADFVLKKNIIKLNDRQSRNVLGGSGDNR